MDDRGKEWTLAWSRSQWGSLILVSEKSLHWRGRGSIVVASLVSAAALGATLLPGAAVAAQKGAVKVKAAPVAVAKAAPAKKPVACSPRAGGGTRAGGGDPAVNGVIYFLLPDGGIGCLPRSG